MAAAGAVFRDPALQGAEGEWQRRERIRAIIADAFDFRSMAGEALGPQWSKLTPENYRGQFSRVIHTSSYATLREKIAAKVKSEN